MVKKIIKKIKKWNKIALFHHINPDGDSISCSYGLALALREVFPKKEIVVVGDFQYLNKNFGFLNFDKKLFKTSIDQTYLTIVGDTSVSKRINNYEEYVKGGFKICFDHHQNKLNAKVDIFWHEPNFPASALQANQIANKLQKNFNESTSIMLLFGILTDTGFFKYSANNQLAPLLFAQRLKSVSHKTISKLYNEMTLKTKKDLELQKIIFDSVKYKKVVAYVIFSKNLINKYGAKRIKQKINCIGNIKGKSIWAFFLPNLTKKNWEVHLRSNGPKVNEVATKFGGGGHFKAAGVKVDTRQKVNQIINELVRIG